MQEILLLTQYFTRIPVKRTLDYSGRSFRLASFFLSLHGAFVALIPTGFALTLVALGAPPVLNAVLSLALSLAVTGAFHLDGFADSLDGLFSGRPRERILEIMKDPVMGSFGTTGIWLDLSLKSYIYYELITTDRILLLPLLAGAGKLALALAASVGKRAKPVSSANALIGNVPPVAVVVNFSVCLALAAALGALSQTALGLVALFLATLSFVAFCQRKINGIVGDNLGFAAETGEILLGIFLIWI